MPRRDPKRQRRAVGLVSGGLDSTLAAEMLARQGIQVTGLHFSTGFCKVDHRRAVRRKKDDDPEKLRNPALRAGAHGGFPVEVIDVSAEYLPMVLNPKHGYGAHANPCIDCRIFMLEKAKAYADARGIDTVFTGEVIGQRPFSQHREAMRVIEKASGLKGRLLRPLSAKHLAPTRAEEEGQIDREELGRIGGRSRREQEKLAQEYGIATYPQPSGGCCYLADETYARRFRDLTAHVPTGEIDQEELVLLKVGRQFRLSPVSKLHVGREEAENAFLMRFAPGRWGGEVLGAEGPTGIFTGAPSDDDLARAAAILARYADLNGAEMAQVSFCRYPPRPIFDDTGSRITRAVPENSAKGEKGHARLVSTGRTDASADPDQDHPAPDPNETLAGPADHDESRQGPRSRSFDRSAAGRPSLPVEARVLSVAPAPPALIESLRV